MNGSNFEDFDLLGARLVDPQIKLNEEKNIYIRKGKIYYDPPPSSSQKEFRLNGHVIVPGLLDLRAHTRVPGLGNSENLSSISSAAARGGFISILAMPDTEPKADNPGTIRFIKDRINQAALVDVHLCGCLTVGAKGEHIAPLGSLKEEGIVAVSDCPYSLSNNQIFLNSIKYAKMFNLTVIEYPQDPSLSHEANAHESAFSLKLGLKGQPRIAEELAVQRAISLAYHLDTHIHLSSLSTAGAVKLVEDAKAKNIKITADVSAHHLFLNETIIEQYNTNAKTNPFLREEKDRLALVSGLSDGVIDACNSSHEPIASHLKEVEYDKAPAGIIGLETAVPLMLKAIGQDDQFTKLATSMSFNPHKILGLCPPSLGLGQSANFTVINPNSNWVYNSTDGQSMSSNTPFDGIQFDSEIVMTVNKGKIIWSN